MIRRALAALLAILAIVGACSGDEPSQATTTLIAPIDGSPPLAVVNGERLPIIDVTKLHDDFSKLTSSEIAGSVSLLVLNQLFFDGAAEQFGLTPSEAQIVDALDVRTERFETEERLQFVLSSQNHTPARLQLEAQLDALRTLVTRHLIETGAPGFDIDLAYNSYLLQEATVCVRHIQVLTEEGYELVVSRLDAGDDFATVALDNSLDPLVDRTDGGSGAEGDLGCRTPASTPFPDAAIDAEIGEFTGPVSSSVGIHLIEVYERSAPPLDEVRNDVLELGVTTQGPELFNEWAITVLQAADVTIADAFGVWGTPPESDIPTVLPAGS